MADYAKLAEHKNSRGDYKRAKKLRIGSSIPEQILWHELRVASQKLKIRFRRQHPIHPYVVDFVCLKIRLVIELDGDSHATQQEYDKKRDDYLRSLGYEIMRSTNRDLVNNRNGVVQTILNRAAELATLTCLSLP